MLICVSQWVHEVPELGKPGAHFLPPSFSQGPGVSVITHTWAAGLLHAFGCSVFSLSIQLFLDPQRHRVLLVLQVLIRTRPNRPLPGIATLPCGHITGTPGTGHLLP